MARKVKLQDTGEFGMSNTSFRAPTGKYYSSEESYNKFQKNKDYREKCIHKMYEVLGYKSGMIIPTYFYKDLKSFEGVGYEALYETMNGKSNDVDWALKNKNFTSETGKVMYVMAIYKNNVMDFYKGIIARDRANQSVVEKVNVEINDIEINTTTKQKGNDVSSLVGDDDWI